MARPLSSATPSSSVTPLSHGLSSLSTWLSTSSCTGTTSRAREASASGGRSTSPLARSPNSFSISVCFPPAPAWVIRQQLTASRLHLLCLVDLLHKHLLAAPAQHGQVCWRGVCCYLGHLHHHVVPVPLPRLLLRHVQEASAQGPSQGYKRVD